VERAALVGLQVGQEGLAVVEVGTKGGDEEEEEVREKGTLSPRRPRLTRVPGITSEHRTCLIKTPAQVLALFVSHPSSTLACLVDLDYLVTCALHHLC
jgi:hypothetical protein